MKESQAIEEGLKLVGKSKVAMLGTLDHEGCPDIRAMLLSGHDGLKTIWFSTNTSSSKVREIKNDGKACVYFSDNARFKGLRLSGKAEILTDPESKKSLWQEWFSNYYSGPDDPDYAMVRFAAEHGSYYCRFENTAFKP